MQDVFCFPTLCGMVFLWPRFYKIGSLSFLFLLFSYLMALSWIGMPPYMTLYIENMQFLPRYVKDNRVRQVLSVLSKTGHIMTRKDKKEKRRILIILLEPFI